MMTHVWTRVKDLPRWNMENTAAESSPASENTVSEAKNNCATEIEDPENESTDAYFSLCM